MTAFTKDIGLDTYWNPFIIMYVLIRSANKEIFSREYRNWVAFFLSANSENANEGSANKELLLYIYSHAWNGTFIFAG